MSEEDNQEEAGTAGAVKPKKVTQNSLATIACQVLEDCLSNIIHDIVLDTHREEKLWRMQSAVILAEQSAITHTEANPTLSNSIPQTPLKQSAAPVIPLPVKIDTPGAIYDNGTISLKGNPLQTTSEILCPQCRLPRLLYPTTGPRSRLVDPEKQYCARHPFVNLPGHDIYGNPFPTDTVKVTKKERELLKAKEAASQQQKETPPLSQPNADGTPGEAQPHANASIAAANAKTATKPATYIPWQTCPSCKRSLLITRFAQHLEKCLGISGRASSKNAMTKLAAMGGGSGTGNTPLGSRMGTPVPGGSQKQRDSPTKRDKDEDSVLGEDKAVKKKKGPWPKKKDRESMAGAERESKLKRKESATSVAAKRLPKENGDAKANGKRGRDEDGDGDDRESTPVKKKIKLKLSDVIKRTNSSKADREKDDGEEKSKKKTNASAASVAMKREESGLSFASSGDQDDD